MINTDKSFAVPVSKFDEELVYRDVRNEPFAIYGIFFENGMFRRIPEKLAHQVNTGVIALHTNTAGGRVKFVTDSTLISVKAKVGNLKHYPHCTLAMTTGFDLYVGRPEEYRATFLPPADVENTYISTVLWAKISPTQAKITSRHTRNVVAFAPNLSLLGPSS